MHAGRLKIIHSLVFLFPLGTTTVQSWHSFIYALLVMFALWSLLRGQWQTPDINLKRYFWVCILGVGLVCLSLLNASDFATSLQRLSLLIYFCTVPLLALLFERQGQDLLKTFFWGLLAAGPILLSVAIFQVVVHDQTRAHGITHPIIFGDISIAWAFLLLFIPVSNRALRKYWPFAMLSACCCVFASTFAISRGGWVAAMIAFVVALVLVRKWLFRKSMLKGAAVLFVAGVVLIALRGDVLLDTIKTSVGNINQFASGLEKNSSAGQRFMMWEIAWDRFREHPVIGSGIGDFRTDVRHAMAAGTTDLREDYSHSHNIFTEYLSMSGLVGFAGMVLFVILAPLRFFYVRWKCHQDTEVFGVACAGIIHVALFTSFGLTECWLARSPMVVVYVTTMALLFAAILGAKRTICETEGPEGPARDI